MADGAGFDISPDGSQLAYVGVQSGVRRLFIRRLDQFDAVPVVGTDGASEAFFSPDGQWVGFVAMHGATCARDVAYRGRSGLLDVRWWPAVDGATPRRTAYVTATRQRRRPGPNRNGI